MRPDTLLEPSAETPDVPAAWWGRPFAETRSMAELARLLVDPVFLNHSGLPRGDGRPVVLMPGFLAGDQTLAIMAGWLRRLGYVPHCCGFVTNTDCSDRSMQLVERHVNALHRRHGRRVGLIGHSRGGHFARAMGARAPDRVSHAISLGADLRGLLGTSVPTRAAVAAIRRGLVLTRRTRADGCLTPACSCPFAEDYRRPFPTDRVRLTSIYSKEDGVVLWEGSVVPEAECIEVSGSHVGLAVNRKSYRAIAEALATPELEG
jgi:pimeloyl-ACP methyl ester carboxylesterase